ncbi:MAG TPA: hypothetical protein PLR25_17685 [Planctomycetaceae bacterium]|nr:hypothetical protein [Planctomycetaceae bacterium]
MIQISHIVLLIFLVLCHSCIDGWPGLESDSSKPRGFLRSAQSNPGHPIDHFKGDRALVSSVQSVCGQESIPATAVDSPVSERQQVIVVIGAPGTAQYRTIFDSWAARWKDAADRAEAGWTLIGAAVDADAETTHDLVSDLDRLKSVISTSSSIETAEPLWIVFIGHGTFDGRTASLNLNGPDVSSESLAEMLRAAKRPVAFIACASCSAPFINSLSAPGRIVISATKDGNQIQYSRFGDAMSQAIAGLDADINRDGQTSLLEAWLFASRRTAEFYSTEGRLATEHALLDDNGDGKGTREEVYDGDRLELSIENTDQLDGALAARWHLVRSNEERRLSTEQRQTRDDLEQKLEDLRRRKDELGENEYLLQLETLLVPLARLYESVDHPTENTEASAEK